MALTVRAVVTDAALAKRRLRLLIRERVDAMPRSVREAADRAACEHLAALLDPFDLVLAYAALPDELSLDPLLKRLGQGGQLLLPKVGAEGMLTVHEVRSLSADTVVGRYGIREPSTPASDRTPTVVCIPGRAFDGVGRRLGRGGGFYDRYLTTVGTAQRVGVAYEAQRVESVPEERHDRRVSVLVTECGIHPFAGAEP